MPEGFSRHPWDSEGCFGPGAHWGDRTQVRLLGDNQRYTLDRAVAVWRQTLVLFGKPPDRVGLIRADFLPENLLDDGKQINLIDFDDSGFGWYMWELATNLFWYYHLPSFTLAKDTLVNGYHQVRALPEEHLQHLEDFIFMRAIVYLGWTVSRTESPDAEHFAPNLINIALQLAYKLLADEGVQA